MPEPKLLSAEELQEARELSADDFNPMFGIDLRRLLSHIDAQAAELAAARAEVERLKARGYSAHVEGYFVVAGQCYRLAKTNDREFCLAHSDCELPPHTTGELLVIVDGHESSRRVEIEGVVPGQVVVTYKTL